MSDTARIQRADSVLSSQMEDGMVMMDIEKGAYYDLDPVGARIWALLEMPRTLDELCQVLTEEFDVDLAACRADTAEFLETLNDKGLIKFA